MIRNLKSLALLPLLLLITVFSFLPLILVTAGSAQSPQPQPPTVIVENVSVRQDNCLAASWQVFLPPQPPQTIINSFSVVLDVFFKNGGLHTIAENVNGSARSVFPCVPTALLNGTDFDRCSIRITTNFTTAGNGAHSAEATVPNLSLALTDQITREGQQVSSGQSGSDLGSKKLELTAIPTTNQPVPHAPTITFRPLALASSQIPRDNRTNLEAKWSALVPSETTLKTAVLILTVRFSDGSVREFTKAVEPATARSAIIAAENPPSGVLLIGATLKLQTTFSFAIPDVTIVEKRDIKL